MLDLQKVMIDEMLSCLNFDNASKITLIMDILCKLIDSVNKENLDIIKTALFAICIDGAGISFTGNRDSKEYMDFFRNYYSKMLLHGEGSTFNSGNRWFDKTMQVTFKNGFDVVVE